MNKIYKVIWSATLGTWVAVSELAKGKTKSSKITGIVGAATVALMVTFSSGAMAAWNTSGNGSNTGGNSSYASSVGGSIAIGNGSTSSTTTASAVETIAIGANLSAIGEQSTVIGNDISASATAIQAVVIGSNFNANPTATTGKGGISIGSGLTGTLKSPTANGIGSVALGSSGDGATNRL